MAEFQRGKTRPTNQTTATKSKAERTRNNASQGKPLGTTRNIALMSPRLCPLRTGKA